MSSSPQLVAPEPPSSQVSSADGRALPARFWALFGAVVSSGIGDGMVVAAFPLLAARLTDDPRLVAGVAVAGALPNLAALHLGALVDRSNRRRLAVSVEFVRALVLLVFAASVASSDPPIVSVYLVVFLIGFGTTITETTAQTVVPELVMRNRLGRANGLLATAETASEHMVGHALGGVLFAVAASLPFFVDGITFFASAALLAVAVPAARARPDQRPFADVGPSATPDGGVAEGLAFFRADRVLSMVAATIVTFAFCQAMVFGPLVLFAQGPLGLGEVGFGLLLALSSVGSMVGGLLAGRVDTILRADAVLILAGLASSVGYLVAGLSRTPLIAGTGLFLEAVWVALGGVAAISLRQRLIPDHLLGRVTGIFRFLVVGSFPLGALAGGLLANAVELRTPLIMASGLQLLAVSLLGRPLRAALSSDLRLTESR